MLIVILELLEDLPAAEDSMSTWQVGREGFQEILKRGSRFVEFPRFLVRGRHEEDRIRCGHRAAVIFYHRFELGNIFGRSQCRDGVFGRYGGIHIPGQAPAADRQNGKDTEQDVGFMGVPEERGVNLVVLENCIVVGDGSAHYPPTSARA